MPRVTFLPWNLSPIGEDEQKHLGNTFFVTKLRLSCRSFPRGDLTVQVPGASPGVVFTPPRSGTRG